jgi:hypothetical protein
MATLAELWDDTPAAKPLPAAPKLTVVPVAPAPAPPPAVQAAPAPVLQAAPAPAPAPPPMATAAPVPTKVTVQEQKVRDQDALPIFTKELAAAEAQAAAGNPRAVQDVAAIKREMTKRGFAIPVAAAAAPAAAASAPQKGSDVGSLGDLFETTIPANQPGSVVQKPVAKTTAFAGTRGDTGIGGGDGPIAQAALKYLKNLGAATASLADVSIGGIIPGVAGPVTYAAGRMFGQTPEQAAAAEKSVVETLDKPFGKTFGVSETGAYKGELSREVMDFIGANIGKGAKYISEKTGLPESDIANMMGTGLVGVAPLAGKAVKPVTGAVGEALYAATEPLVRDKTVLAQRPKIEPTLPPQPLDVNLRPVEVTVPGQMSAKMLADTQAAFAKRQEAAAAAKAAMPPPAATPTAVALPAGAAPGAGLGATPGSVGAAGVPTITTIQQALVGATPELKAVLSGIPFEQTNVPTFMRHIEADSLPVPVRLTEGQATGDIVKLSNEQNRRGRDPELAQRFNEQNGLLIENLNEIRGNAAPDAYGTKIIENSQGIIDAYKTIDTARSEKITAAYKALEDANGGQFPIDGITLAKNAETMLGKKLKTEFLSPSIKSQLERFKSGEPMTFENFEAMRTNLAAEIRKAERSGDGNAAMASSIVREALEQLPLTGQAAGKLKPLADTARGLAKERFDMLKKDPAYKAAVDDAVAADKYLQKFVVNGVNKNIATMVNHLGKDSVAHQHMAAGTVNWLKDKAGIVDETGNFTQAGFNKALKQLDDVKNMEQIFTPDAASQLKTLGNVARYTQAQPRGAFVNNSNTLVGALAERAKQGVGAAVQGGLNAVVPGLQLGTTVMEMRARRANAAEVKKALELGAGAKNK